MMYEYVPLYSSMYMYNTSVRSTGYILACLHEGKRYRVSIIHMIARRHFVSLQEDRGHLSNRIIYMTTFCPCCS